MDCLGLSGIWVWSRSRTKYTPGGISDGCVLLRCHRVLLSRHYHSNARWWEARATNLQVVSKTRPHDHWTMVRLNSSYIWLGAPHRPHQVHQRALYHPVGAFVQYFHPNQMDPHCVLPSLGVVRRGRSPFSISLSFSSIHMENCPLGCCGISPLLNMEGITLNVFVQQIWLSEHPCSETRLDLRRQWKLSSWKRELALRLLLVDAWCEMFSMTWHCLFLWPSLLQRLSMKLSRLSSLSHRRCSWRRWSSQESEWYLNQLDRYSDITTLWERRLSM